MALKETQLTCGLTSTKSMNSTMKSCSTYLSAKRLHRGHWVNRTSPPTTPSDGDSSVSFLAEFVTLGETKPEGVAVDFELPLALVLGVEYADLWLLLWRT